jgi:hypothetical protein
MPVDFSTYLIQLSEALQAQDGPVLAFLLRPTSPHGKDLVKEFRNPSVHSPSLARLTQTHGYISVNRFHTTKELLRVRGMILRYSMS